MSDSQPESQPQPEPEPEAKRKQNVRLDASVRKIIELELKCGQSAAAIQERLSAGGMNVSRSQLCRLMRRWKETGTTATTGPETRGRKQVIKPEHLAALLQYLQARPNAENAELAKYLGETFGLEVSPSTVSRCVRRAIPTRRKLRKSVTAVDPAMTTPPFVPAPAASPGALGVHHVKVPCAALEAATTWYHHVLGFARIHALDHRRPPPDARLFAVIGRMPGWAEVLLELRQNRPQAERQRGFDALTLKVQALAELETWARWLDANQVKRSRVLTGVRGWVLVFEDPSGQFLRLYTVETHEMTTNVDEDEYWLGPAGVW